MLDLPGLPTLDKQRLIGGCVRLPLRADPERLIADLAAMPLNLWGTRGGRVGVHQAAEAVFLRGSAPAEGDLPIENRPALQHTPYIENFIFCQVPARPLRCLLARLPGGAAIAPHVDRPPYFGKSLRLHVPVQTHARAWMMCNGWCYRMAAGEVWALNNSAAHAVWNEDPEAMRTHLICDFYPDPELLQLIAAGEHHLGVRDTAVEAHLSALTAG